MALDKLGICNEAIAELPSQAIEDFDEGTEEAMWAVRRYGPALAYMLERHDWQFPTARVALAQIDNDRSTEWLYAYQSPSNVAAELRLLPSDIVNPEIVPLLVGQVLAPAYIVPASYRQFSYLLAGQTIYTNVEAAVLEYIRDDVSEAVFPALFTRAFVLELASRLAVPILEGDKGAKRQRELKVMAENERDIAISDALNRDPTASRYDNFVNETQLAREGFMPGTASPFGYGRY